MTTIALSVDGLTSGYGPTVVLHDLSLVVESGDAFALVGKNGAGKSTLLKTVIGVLPRQEGTVRIFGKVVGTRGMRGVGHGIVGYAPQDNAFFVDLSVDENLKLSARGLGRRRFRERRDRMIELFPFLGKRLTQRAGTLSGGEQKMLNVARALLQAPRLVLLDEVSEGLQPSMVDRVQEALAVEREINGLTLLLVEQNIDFVLALGDKYGLLDRGELVASGNLADDDAKDRIERHLVI